ncbi:MAG: ABC transporter C-terminal domain-containing protein, partial [Acidimicrobiales bacterium]
AAARRPPIKPPASAVAPAKTKARTPSTLRRLLAQAERDLADTTATRDRLATDLAAGGDHTAVARLAQELAAAESQLSEVEERWLALAEELGS